MKPRRFAERHDRVEVGDGGRDVVRVGGVGVVTGISAGTRPWQGRAGWLARPMLAAEQAAPISRRAASRRGAANTLPPMTLAIVVVVEAGLEQRVGQLDHARSRRTGSGRAPSKSEPSATCSAPATSIA